MTNYSNQDFNQESFGQPVTTERRGGGGSRAFLFSCGGLSLVGFLICCCCAGVSVFALRQPEVVVAVWGAAAQQDWGLADNVICDGSGAAVLTDNYNRLGVTVTELTAQARAADAQNTIVATGTINYDGTSEPWEATFYMLEEGSGFFPLCISSIEVSQGGIVGTDAPDNPNEDAENNEADEENATSDE